MGYCIEFALHAGTLEAVVSGKGSEAFARFIARGIAEEAARRRGTQMRRFPDAKAAMKWLCEPTDRLS